MAARLVVWHWGRLRDWCGFGRDGGVGEVMGWARYDPNGYEVSSRGDCRFSALYARMPDGRTIEMHYQCDVKGYQPGGTWWRMGKGRPPLRDVNLAIEYFSLWSQWAQFNPELIAELKRLRTGKNLTDCFAKTSINQAWALDRLTT